MGNERAAGDNLASGVAFAAGIGAVAGAALAARGGLRARAAGALVGAATLGAVDYAARKRQKPNEIPALWSRIAASAALAAPAGWLADRLGAGPVAVGTGAGTIAGALGLRPQKVALGPVVGAAVGAGFRAADPDAPGALVAATTVLAYRTLSAAGLPRRAGEPAGRARRRRPTCRSSCPLDGAQPRTSAPATCEDLAEDSAAPTPAPPRTSASSRPLDELAGPSSTRRRSIRSCASSTSTPPASRSTSCRSGGCGCARATCSTARSWPGRSVRPTSR